MKLGTAKKSKHRSVVATRRGANATQAGFSLIEMTMGMVLFGIALGAMLGLLEVGRKTRMNTMQNTEDIQDVRIALNQMSRDVLNAGVDYPNVGPQLPTNWLYNNLGLAASSPTGTVDSLTPVVPGYGPNLNFTNSGSPNSTLKDTQVSPTTTVTCDQLTLVSVNYLFNPVSPTTDNNTVVTAVTPVVMAGTNTVNAASQTASLQITTPTGNSNSAGTVCNVGDIYFLWWGAATNGVIGMVTSLTKTTVSNDTIVLATADPLGLNSFVTTSSTAPPYDIGAIPTGNVNSNPVSAYKLNFVTYYVKDDGTGRGTGVLTRRTYGGSSGGLPVGITDQPLVYDVVNLTMNYILSNQTITRNPTLAQFQNIRQIAVSVSVASQTATQVANQSQYSSATKSAEGSNAYSQSLYQGQKTLTAVMNTRNLGYEKN